MTGWFRAQTSWLTINKLAQFCSRIPNFWTFIGIDRTVCGRCQAASRALDTASCKIIWLPLQGRISSRGSTRPAARGPAIGNRLSLQGLVVPTGYTPALFLDQARHSCSWTPDPGRSTGRSTRPGKRHFYYYFRPSNGFNRSSKSLLARPTARFVTGQAQRWPGLSQ